MIMRCIIGSGHGCYASAWTGASALKWGSHIQSRRSASLLFGVILSALTRVISFVIRDVQKWARSSVAITADSGLAGYVVSRAYYPRKFRPTFPQQELQRIISRSLDLLYSGTDSASGLLENCDYLLVIKTFETQVLASRQHWETVAAAIGGDCKSFTQSINATLRPLLSSYSPMVRVPELHIAVLFPLRDAGA